MKTISQTILATAVLSVFAVSANAAISYGTPGVGQPYVGVKVGQIDADLAGAPKATTYGVYGGYNFSPNFGTEVEFLGSENKAYRFGNADYEYNAKTYGAYSTYRYDFGASPVYVKAKAGVARTNIKDKGKTASYDYKRNTTSLAGGVGIGFAPSQNFGIEASYNYLNKSNKAMMVGAHIGF